MNRSCSFSILVAEDNEANQLFIRFLLEDMGHSVTVVGNGVEVLEALIQKPYDCVLMDIRMPRMDGIAATRAIREGEAGSDRSHTPIIALTGYAIKNEQNNFQEAGMDAYITKPLEKDELASTIERIMAMVDQNASGVSSESKKDILDAEKTLNRLNRDEKFTALLYRTFLEELDERLQKFLEAQAAGDLDQLLKRAHSLKGAAATIDAERMRQASLDMETAAREGDLDKTILRLQDVKIELNNLARELENWLKKNGL